MRTLRASIHRSRSSCESPAITLVSEMLVLDLWSGNGRGPESIDQPAGLGKGKFFETGLAILSAEQALEIGALPPRDRDDRP